MEYGWLIIELQARAAMAKGDNKFDPSDIQKCIEVNEPIEHEWKVVFE